MRATITATLEADATLMAILTGGVHDGVEISRQDTPGAFDANEEIEPCALVKLTTEVPDGPHDAGAVQYFNIFLYERSGFTNIDAARARIWTLLHKQKLGSGTYEVAHADDVLDQEEPALGCSMARSRYMATRLRTGG